MAYLANSIWGRSEEDISTSYSLLRIQCQNDVNSVVSWVGLEVCHNHYSLGENIVECINHIEQKMGEIPTMSLFHQRVSVPKLVLNYMIWNSKYNRMVGSMFTC